MPHPQTGFEILAGDDEALISRLTDLVQKRKFDSDEVLISQGHEDDQSVHILLSGSARVVLFSRAGHEMWLSELGKGDLFGEMAALLGIERSSTVIATKAGEIASMRGADFTALMQSSVAFAGAVARLQARRVLLTSQRMFESNALSIPARVYSELLRVGQAVHGEPEKLNIIPPLKVSELAPRINASRETVSRTIGEFERQGLLKRAKSHWQILQPEFDPNVGYELYLSDRIS